MSRQYHLYPHAGCGNHGCEAIARATISLLPGKDVRLYTFRRGEDQYYGLRGTGAELGPVGIRPVSIKRALSVFHSRILKNKLYYIDQSFPALYGRRFDDSDWLFSIGGDNYCYANMVERMGRLNNLLRENGARHLVLWGCSIEPDLFEDSRMIADLKGFERLVPRESITLEAMNQAGFEDKAVLAPDPAFLLPAVKKPFPTGLEPGNTVGINVSPLVLKRGISPELVYGNYRRLAENILERTDMGILLVPHVVWGHEDDREPLKKLYQQFSKTGRVALAEDGNAMELKGYIGRCRFFVGARTHSTIAAYSSGVPALAAGYSVKARGIARDLFGTEQNFVIPVQEMDREEELSRAFQWLVGHEETVRKRLLSYMADYPSKIRRAMEGL